MQDSGVSRRGIAQSCLEAPPLRQQHTVRSLLLAGLGAPVVIITAGRPDPAEIFPFPPLFRHCHLTKE